MRLTQMGCILLDYFSHTLQAQMDPKKSMKPTLKLHFPIMEISLTTQPFNIDNETSFYAN